MRNKALDRVFSAARSIWEKRNEIRERFVSPESIGYWDWLTSDGWFEEPEMQEVLPVPPPSLMGNVIGAGADPSDFVRSGASDAHNIFACLNAARSLSEGGRLLDFGCGCGRILRIFSRLGDTWELHGVDVDRDAVAWCEEHLGFAQFQTIKPRPPLPFDEAFVDLVYAFSVFSHLPEALHLDWLRDIARVLTPGGVAVLTIMSDNCLRRIVNEDSPARIGGVCASQLRSDSEDYRRTGYLYYPYENPVSLAPEDADAGLYGMTFMTRDYVEREWTRIGFELAEYRAAPQDWQDYVVLRRRP